MTAAFPEHRAAGRRTRMTAARWRLAFCAVALAWASLLLPCLAWAQDLQRVPSLTGHVVDHSATLPPDQARSLEAKLAAFEAERGTQIVILMVPGTAPEDIAAFAFRVADEWKIGRREVGDGILLVVAKDERRVRIEVARALEGAVPDLAAFQIINRVITPAFREGDYAGGLHAGADALMARIRGENLPAPETSAPAPTKPSMLEGLGALLFMGVPLVGAVLVGTLGRKLGTLATSGAAGAFALFITSSVLLALLAAALAFIFVLALGVGGGGGGGRGGPHMGGGPVIWGGGGRGGRSGGGFRSGGGGSFGGGGASGGW